MATKSEKKTYRYLLLILLFILAGGWGWYLWRGANSITNVLLISIDTCRADHLSCYGFDRSTTPNIDEIARQGLLYTHAYTPIPLTLPAHCSMLTGTYPPYHQVRHNVRYKLRDTEETLAEILQEHGYATGAVLGAYILKANFGTHQGFDSYDDAVEGASGSDKERSAELVSQRACEYLEKHKDEPFFLFLHFYDPHDPYEPPEPYTTRYRDDFYAGEIAYTDQQIGKVIDRLKRLDLYDSTLILIVGDHGESLGEHGEAEHGYYIYQSTIHVPFIVRVPESTKPTRIEDAISLVDVMPTVLGYLDIPIPQQVQGIDLSGYSRGRPPVEPERKIYTESVMVPGEFGCNPLLGLIEGPWSYIRTNRPELYDLVVDREQQNNLAGLDDQRVRLMEGHLQDIAARILGNDSTESRLEMDSESLERLKSLGYVGGTSVRDSLELDLSRKDAKDMIQCNEYKEEAVDLMAEGKYDEAREICRKMIAQWPEVPINYSLMMDIVFKTEQYEDTLKYGALYYDIKFESVAENQSGGNIQNDILTPMYLKMIESAVKLNDYQLVMEYCNKQLRIQPDSMEIRNTLAAAYMELGQHDQALQIWDDLLRQHPGIAEIHKNLGQAYYRLGDLDQAEIYCSQALRLNPGLTEARNALKVISRLRQLDQIIAREVEKLRRQPDNPAWHDGLANLFYERGLFEDAVRHWREVIRLRPEAPEAYNKLARVLVNISDPTLRDPDEALVLAEKAAELTRQTDANILETLSMVYAANGKYAEAIRTAEQALPLAQAAGNKALAETLRQQIIKFKTKRDRNPQHRQY